MERTFKLSGGRKLVIDYDTWADDPRNWDNISKMICFHRRYDLGDKHSYSHSDYDSWDEMERVIIKNEDVAIILPLYLYDHSGISISTSPFSCPWDSGQVGFVCVSKDVVRNEYGVKRITKDVREKANQILLAEIDTYNKFIEGEVYGFQILSEDDDVEDSCWGFYGSDIENNGILDNLSSEDYEQVKQQL